MKDDGPSYLRGQESQKNLQPNSRSGFQTKKIVILKTSTILQERTCPSPSDCVVGLTSVISNVD